ncbi:discoidin domain-containing receptor 2 [Caerostris darwini]|uniref:Discoidin domain-containing receptor 2 n=1 Tax=Caerostris darwini TaxID=1538125 RepID=A0AAV4TPH8_9ARAC|nr:discoidin domain-containing receptor 2 [Caerostris darwini]
MNDPITHSSARTAQGSYHRGTYSHAKPFEHNRIHSSSAVPDCESINAFIPDEIVLQMNSSGPPPAAQKCFRPRCYLNAIYRGFGDTSLMYQKPNISKSRIYRKAEYKILIHPVLTFADSEKMKYFEHMSFKKMQRHRVALIFKGNTNTYTSVKRIVDPPIIASKIRFVPYSVHPRTVCMRVELYGCVWNDGLVSYAMPQGERRGTDVDLADKIYDGIKDDSRLQGGLGQLTDGRTGGDHFADDAHGFGKGYEWVGWRNGGLSDGVQTGSRSIEILFTFDVVRNFSALYFHCNNMHSASVQVFSSARIWFSVGGRHFLGRAVHFSYMPDLFFERARNVTVLLHHGVGRALKVELHFAAPWMLLSEVGFDSVPAVGNFTEEEPPAVPPIVSTALNEDALDNQYVGLVIGVLAAVILVLVVVIFVIVARNKRRKNTSPHNILSPGVAVNMKDFSPSHLNTGSVCGRVAADTLPQQEPQEMKANYSGAYCNGNLTFSLSFPRFSLRQRVRSPGLPVGRDGHPGRVRQHSVRGSAPGREVAAVHSRDPPPQAPAPREAGGGAVRRGGCCLLLPPSSSQSLIRPIAFVLLQVHLCHAEGFLELVDGPSHTLVAVKSVGPGESTSTREDFFNEVRVLSRLRDPNIVCVLGVCTQGEGPLCMVVEYMEKGDLHQHLRKRAPPEETGAPPAKKTLSYGCLIYMATQIASGMKYLESLNFVHRDLATRNCLVGRHHLIKIGDFGMSRGLYGADYYRIQGRAVLPIRWMAWESMLLGKFTTQSDVWAFAVTLWEILTFARHRPYGELSDEQVVENAGLLYEGDGRRTLPRPPHCPREIYDLMRECWRRDEADRPNFREIHLFLQRKNLGYSPHPPEAD